MARPLRIQFPDAWYHVTNRGRRGDLIFKDKGDCYAFVDLLKDCIEMWNIRVAAYCLMGTHYHILLQTPDANVSRCMRHINNVYTQYFNRSTDWTDIFSEDAIIFKSLRQLCTVFLFGLKGAVRS
jgi:REP-associated tyrosine transposase